MDTVPSSVSAASTAGVRGIFTLFREAWNTYVRHLKDVLFFQLITGLLYIGGWLFVAMFGGGLVFGLIVVPLSRGGTLQWSSSLTLGVFLLILLALIAVLAAVWIGASQTLFYLRLLETGSTSFGAAFKEGFRRFLGFLGTSILSSLIVMGGLVLLVVPGVYWGIRFGFAPLVYLAEGLGPRAALRRSWALTAHVGWVVLARWYVAAIIGIALGVCQAIPLIGPFILGPFFVMPLLTLLSWYIFREFQHVKNADPSYHTPYGVGKKVALLVPFVLGPLLFGLFISGVVMMARERGNSSAFYGTKCPPGTTCGSELTEPSFEFYDDVKGGGGPSEVPIPPAFDERGSETSS